MCWPSKLIQIYILGKCDITSSGNFFPLKKIQTDMARSKFYGKLRRYRFTRKGRGNCTVAIEKIRRPQKKLQKRRAFLRVN